MKLTTKITFDTSKIEKGLQDKFGRGSDAQYYWSRLVWISSEPYVPFRTGMFVTQSLLKSLDTFREGYITYVPRTADGWSYLPRWLWDGLSPSGKPLNYTQAAGRQRGVARWVIHAANNHYNEWVAEMQRWINNGMILMR